MALGALLAVAVQIGDPIVIVGFSVFGFTMVLLYTMSTLYHSFHPPELKRLFKVLDHIAIYLLIAGTYTPLMLISMRDGSGYAILAAVWLLALLSSVSEVSLSGRAVKICQLVVYLAMGWACSLDIAGLEEGLPSAGFNWLVAPVRAVWLRGPFHLYDRLRQVSWRPGNS